MELVQRGVALSRGRWNSYSTLADGLGSVGSESPITQSQIALHITLGHYDVDLSPYTAAVRGGTLAAHCPTTLGQWVVESLLHRAALPGGSGQWSSRNATPYCMGAKGGGNCAIHRATASRR